jgi:two-component system LytT family response regulator
MTRRLCPELIFLDVELPDGSAFDFLELSVGVPLKVIIISAHAAHSLRAFKYATTHYLLKPIELGDLKEAISRVMGPAPSEKPAHVAATASARPGELIALPTLEGFKMVSIHDIVYLQAESNYTEFYFQDGAKFLVSNTLGYYETLLGDKPFYRVHNKSLVHFAHIVGYHKGRGGWVEMSNGDSVEVSVRRRDGFLGKLAEYIRGI